MNYDEALEYIHGTMKFGSKLGLHNIGVLLGLMGEPHKKLKYVHIAGTNGKGSTSAYISSILAEAGYRTGLFTSPFIQRFTERIRIGDEEISPAELAEITSLVKGCVDRMIARGESHPTEFEIVTAIAFEYFYRKKCDIVVLEVGLGGRFDSTNIIDTPEVAVIATINYDHTDILGKMLPEIAFEKAGIIKPGGDVVIYGQGREVEEVFENACAERGAKLTRTDFSGIVVHDFGIDGQTFSFEKYDRLKIKLLGRHQTRNAALAVKSVEILREKGFAIPDEALRRGLEKTRWPGRLEVLSKDPVVLIDGAHNAEGAVMLKNAIDEYFPGRPITYIIGVLKDKDYREMMKTVLPGCKRVFAVTTRSPKALPAEILSDIAADYCKNVQVSDTIESAVRKSIETAESGEVICAFGSLYYVGVVRDMFG